MLSELYIADLALIEEAVIPFSDNFNVFTGETGAGKSILINGINAVLGHRTSKDIVRSGCEKAVITAMFKNLFPATKQKLDEYGIDYSDDELSITREIFADGGSSARINSKPANISVVKDIGETLVNIHGQHDNHILLSPDKHLGILDAYAGLENQLEDYRTDFKELQSVSRQLKTLANTEKDKAERIQLLTQRVADISALDIQADEDQQIEDEYNLAKNSVEISRTVQEAVVTLNGDDINPGIISQISIIADNLSVYSDLMNDLSSLNNRLVSLKIELDDICSELININDRSDCNPERYSYLLERRQKLYEIKKKYGPDLSNVLKTLSLSENELDNLNTNTDNIKKLAEHREALLKCVSEKANKLSENRKEAGLRFAGQVQEELKFLDMPNVRIEVKFVEGKLTSYGMDSVEFYVSANIGEEPKPISKFASGGELSRIMLALKNVIAEKDEVPTMIFDEIDTGVSGRAAQKIGIKLKEISRIRQVICVTHLSQIAVKADNHLLIEKMSDNNRTFTTVKKLTFDERKYEIARILCGDNITETVLKNAEEQLK